MTAQYNENNVFAKIINEEIPCNKVYEDENTLAFHDINPLAKIHILVIPKARYISFNDFIIHSSTTEIVHFFKVVHKIASTIVGGYRLITNHGANAEQIVPHFHVHLLGGGKLSGFSGKF